MSHICSSSVKPTLVSGWAGREATLSVRTGKISLDFYFAAAEIS